MAYNTGMDEEDVVLPDEQSIDDDRLRALIEQYIDEDTAVRLENG